MKVHQNFKYMKIKLKFELIKKLLAVELRENVEKYIKLILEFYKKINERAECNLHGNE